jgi:hemerythrin-like domain-containing protein
VLLLVGHDRLEALAILEAVVLECKKREIDARNVKAALDFLEPYIRPQLSHLLILALK